MKMGFLGDIYVPDGGQKPFVDDGLKKLLAGCDHVICNLEAPITAKSKPIDKIGPPMRQGANALDLVTQLHVSVVGLANNHILDYGGGGLSDTLDVIRQSKMSCVGAAPTADETYRPLRLVGDSVEISVIVAAENGFGCSSLEHEGPSYAWIFHPRLREAVVSEARRVDHVVVFVHAGVEYIDRPIPEWRRTYRDLIDDGASMVIAHHPHVTQGYEIYRNRPIFYSLGNCYFGHPQSDRRWYYSIVPIVELSSKGAYSLTICHCRFDDDGWLGFDGAGWGAARFDALSQELTAERYTTLVDLDVLERWKKFYAEAYEEAINGATSSLRIKRWVNRTTTCIVRRKAMLDPLILWHNLEIESHRWTVARAMRLLNGG